MSFPEQVDTLLKYVNLFQYKTLLLFRLLHIIFIENVVYLYAK